MARTDDALLCPSCGARNKAKWEFCARCGESLQGAETLVKKKADAPRKDDAGGRKKGAFKAQVHGGRPEGSPLWAGLALVALVATVGAGVWYAAQRGPAPTPRPAAGMTVPTQPPKPAPSTPPVEGQAQARFLDGQRLLLAGDAQGALASLAQAVAEEPGNALYQYAYGEALVKAGSVDEGLSAMAEAARIDPATYRMNYAKQLGVSGRPAQAAAEMQALMETSPDDPEALRGAGWSLCQQKDFARGLPMLRRAAELRGSDPGILESLAAMQAANGDYKDAAGTYTQVLSLQPKNRQARTKLADALVRSGSTDEAIDTLRRGVAAEPTAPELWHELGALMERVGRPADAAALYRGYAEAFPDAADAAALLRKAQALAPGGSDRS